MARRGFFSRIIGGIRRAFGGKPEAPPPPPRPTVTPAVPRIPELGDIRSTRRQVVDRMLSLSALANAQRIAQNVRTMTPEELQWSLRATIEQLRNRARRDADRLRGMPDGGAVPVNPWWYR